jgi:hypothetical protein
MTGDLELIENENNSFENNGSKQISIKKKLEKRSFSPGLRSTAEGVKVRVESQIKSILRNNNNSIRTSNYDKINQDQEESTDLQGRSQSRVGTSSARRSLSRTRHNMGKQQEELYKQINQHSFKDIDLIKIEPRIEPTELKDPIASAESKIPVINTRYLVNILKKPYSLKWLRNRRLALFLQSELYNEFKLGMVLAQLAKFNNELSCKRKFIF